MFRVCVEALNHGGESRCEVGHESVHGSVIVVKCISELATEGVQVVTGCVPVDALMVVVSEGDGCVLLACVVGLGALAEDPGRLLLCGGIVAPDLGVGGLFVGCLDLGWASVLIHLAEVRPRSPSDGVRVFAVEAS